MARYAVVENDKVKMVTETTPEFAAAKGWIAAASASPGDDYVGGEFVAPTQAVIVPKEVTAFQAKAALQDAGLLDDFQTLIDDVGTSAVIKLAWTCASVFLRDSPAVIDMSTTAGLTSGEVDDLFIAAANISV